MGFMNYFKITPKLANKTAENEKTPSLEAHAPPSIALSSRPASSRSTVPSGQRHVDDIKHQVMLNRLCQQQRSQLWIQDLSGQTEGVMLRKDRNSYMFSPPSLSNSAFAHAMKLLNVQVSLEGPVGRPKADILSGCHDCKFRSHPTIP
jgi:hypothetical protein